MNLLSNRARYTVVIIIISAILLFFLGKDLNPFSSMMFSFHDKTQNARVISYAAELALLHIPPQLAPQFSFNLGMPIFLLYAPTAYIFTSIFNILGLNASSSIQLSFLCVLLIGFLGTFLFLKNKFGEFPAIAGGIVYVTSLYIPTTIFVRGNLAEGWLLALLPLSLWFLTIKKYSFIQFLFGIIIISLLLTSHNALSMISLLVLIGFVVVSHAGKATWAMLALGLLTSSYFYVPLLFENGLTWAKTVALQTNYDNHFICLRQLWNSPWGFGGSTQGCVLDGMSFKIGKIHILLFLLSSLSVFYAVARQKISKQKQQYSYEALFFVCILCLSVFMALNFSEIFWDTLPVLQLFQYPWRFLIFIPIAIAFVSAYQLNKVPEMYKKIVVLILVFSLLIVNKKYFYGQTIQKSIFEQKYSSTSFITKKAAFSIPEYVPKTVDYTYWRALENNPEMIGFDYNKPFDAAPGMGKVTKNESYHKTYVIEKRGTIFANIHYMPYWHISIDGKQIIPTKFDKLGRPQITVYTNGATIDVEHKQTVIENIGAVLTLFAFILGVLNYRRLYGKNE